MYEHNGSIDRILGEQARRDPAATAVLEDHRAPLTYGGLWDQVTSARADLRALGIRRGQRVAVVLPNGPEMATAFLAVSCATTCAPLNPAYRDSEFDFYLADLQASAVIVQRDLASPVRDVARSRGIAVFELQPDLESGAGVFRLTNSSGGIGEDEPARADDVALVLHTSGTTSRPKLVPLTHANLCASAANIAHTLQLQPEDRCLNMMPLFHIHGLAAALLATMISGGSVICTPGFEGASFFTWLEQLEPTWYTAVPTIHQAVLAAAAERAGGPARHQLRFVRSSSSSLPPTVMRNLETEFGVPVLEAYGMTEAAHQMCSNPLPPGVRKPGSVGLPAGPDVAIMDEQGTLLAQGRTGEVVIRGGNVMPGYVANSDANRTAFVDGWFRTGDRGFFDDDGYLFLAGRIKEIINRGSEKISPREIDEVLLEHPAVAQAVAFAVPHPTLGEDVAAAVVLRANATASAAEIRELAFQRLAAFKVPSRVVLVDAIPKGPTGKIQRIGLADKLTRELTTEFVAPGDEIDALLADIWREILGVPAVGMLDNFFALGGDSLRGTRVMARVNELFDLSLPVAVAFRYPTLEQFSSEVRRAAPAERLQAVRQTLRELDAMPDEEARRLLDAESETS